MKAIEFASYGTAPGGSCGAYTQPACLAANSTSYVTSECVGKLSCRIWPNTTTFGDPCFLTAKELVVQAQCSSGPGTATPGCAAGNCPAPPAPPAPPPGPYAASVKIDWAGNNGSVATTPSLQVVAHALLMRDSPMHDKVFDLLAQLDASLVRYVPWLPTPRLGVAALEPPSFGGAQARGGTGGKRNASGGIACTTSWNFTLLDEQMLDYWAAVGGQQRPQIPNFSTPPTWLYDNTSWSYNAACTGSGPDHCTMGGYERGPAPASAHGGLQALGDYYGRLLAWYTKGGFVDECGVQHTGGHHLNITIWEVYNEVDYEHGHTPASYVADFDAIVRGIRKFADPEKKIAFVGMNLPNIDDASTVVEWAQYFLNASNHAEDTRDALQYIGYHAYPTGDYGNVKTKDDMSKFFDYVDFFVDGKSTVVQAVIDSLSPGTKTMLDENGLLGPLFGGLDDPSYWVAGGAYWAYFWARAAVRFGSKIAVVGQSQFMDSPDREPGVTMMDWRNGNGTAKYWVARLVIESVSLGDQFHPSASTSPNLYAQAFTHFAAGQVVSGAKEKRVLLINKKNAPAAVTVPGALSALAVDETTHQSPPRSVPIGTNGVLQLGAYSTAVVIVG